MSTAEERIRDLARKSAIDDEAAARLLEAVRPAPPRPSWNPFERLSPAVSCALGAAASAAMVGLSRLHVRTPGTLDLQHTSRAITLSTALLDQLVAFPLTALVLWGAARVLVPRVRVVDVLAAVGLARVPPTVLALPLALVTPAIGIGAGAKPAGPALYLVLFLALVAIASQVTLLVLGVRTATGLRGGRLAAAIAGGLVVAEIVGKIALAVTPLP